MDDLKILELAEQAGLAYPSGGEAFNAWKEDVDITPYLLAFARLVAAAERENCAKQCDDYAGSPFKYAEAADAAEHLADAIRAGKSSLDSAKKQEVDPELLKARSMRNVSPFMMEITRRINRGRSVFSGQFLCEAFGSIDAAKKWANCAGLALVDASSAEVTNVYHISKSR